MNERIRELVQRIKYLETELEDELARQRVEFNFIIRKGKVRFEQVMIARRRAAKVHVSKYVMGARPIMVMTAPVIYSLAAAVRAT